MTPELGVALSPSAADFASTSVGDLVDAVLASGFTSLWTLDNPLADQAEPLVFLSAAAARDVRLSVGTAAIVAPVRDPILLAKQVATLDRLTGGGRVTLGLTIGRRPAEYEVIGHDYHQRGRVLADVVQVLHQCWAGGPVAVAGAEQSWSSVDAIGVAPATPGGPPILLGGQAPPALERAVRLADGYLGSATGGPRTAIATLGKVRELLAQQGERTRPFRAVTNVFVVVASTRAAAIDAAGAAFATRHGGRPAPWDPADVVLGGQTAEIAEGVAELVDAGYEGVTLVPVLGTIEQVRALEPVVAAVAAAPASARP
jgi:alkanesulfonate monooxygenase SsuD/methylene tetrahydromethanopterin reductase-like flavin-dependent oxidoreductase (luciferase family)